jgi:hypothetical protein
LLRDLQIAFAGALLEDGMAAASTHAAIHAGRLSPQRRIEIYRHNVLANLRGTLAEIYPVVQTIVGEAFFAHAADQFIRVTPSRSGDLNQFGREWAEFLSTYPHAKDLPYLGDVARLEWAWHMSFHAAEHAPFDLARLADIQAEQYGALRFQLHSSVHLMSSQFPLFRIWEVNQAGYAGSMEIDWPQALGDYLLVHRDGVEVTVRTLAEGAYRFLAALSAGADLERAAEQAIAADAGFELQGFLIEFVQSGVIVNFSGE